jgi:hypothetical protein
MTEHPSPALQVALAYHQAWTSKEMEAAMGHLKACSLTDATVPRSAQVTMVLSFSGGSGRPVRSQDRRPRPRRLEPNGPIPQGVRPAAA